MIEQIYIFFNYEMIFLWINIGVIPFWLVLLFFSDSRICNFFVTSSFPYFIFGFIYIYLIYYFFINDYDFSQNFSLYLGLDELKNLFTYKEFIISFWVHFLAINLFCGSWIVRDSKKFLISKYLVFFPVITTYFVGPLGLFFYWLIRIFYAKKISLYD